MGFNSGFKRLISRASMQSGFISCFLKMSMTLQRQKFMAPCHTFSVNPEIRAQSLNLSSQNIFRHQHNQINSQKLTASSHCAYIRCLLLSVSTCNIPRLKIGCRLLVWDQKTKPSCNRRQMLMDYGRCINFKEEFVVVVTHRT